MAECEICGEETVVYTCKGCGVQFCKDCGSSSEKLCVDCQTEAEEG